VVRGFYEAVARGDASAVLDLLDPQVELTAPTSVPWGGTFKGREGAGEMFAMLAEQPMEFRREPQDYLDLGERVVVTLRVFGRPKAGGTEFEVPEVHVWTVRQGRIIRLEAYFDTALVLSALAVIRPGSH
jgi:hypothetical protein